jgi:hypothetical protein
MTINTDFGSVIFRNHQKQSELRPITGHPALRIQIEVLLHHSSATLTLFRLSETEIVREREEKNRDDK